MRISVTGPTAWLIGGTNQGWVPPMHPAGGEALFQTAARLSSFCTPSCAPLIYPPTSFGLVGRSQWVSAKKSFSDKLFAWRGGVQIPHPPNFPCTLAAPGAGMVRGDPPWAPSPGCEPATWRNARYRLLTREQSRQMPSWRGVRSAESGSSGGRR